MDRLATIVIEQFPDDEVTIPKAQQFLLSCPVLRRPVAFQILGLGPQPIYEGLTDYREALAALVEVKDCAVYDTQLAMRMEDGLRDLKIDRLGFGKGITRKYQMVKGPFPGYENRGEYEAAPWEEVLKKGLSPSE